MDNWSKLLVSLRADEKFPLTPDTEGSKSTYTRLGVPASYDKHLSSNLTLLRTEIPDSLPGILVENAEAKIKLMQEAHKDQPPDRLVFPKPPIPRQVMSKAGVRYWYSKRADNWCEIATALRLHNGNWNWSMLEYTIDLMPRCALVDAAIIVLDDTAFNYLARNFPSFINDEMRAVWKMLRERTVENTIISWEFKGVSAGSEEIMENIVHVIRSGSFQWEYCAKKKKCKKHELEQHSPHVGCDTSNPLVGLPSNALPDDDDESGPTRKRQRLITKEEREGEETMGLDTLDGSHGTCDGSDCQNLPEKKAHDFIQRVWAQACIKDLTYFVIHSGNFELICIRHRGSRTLYCSDLIERCKNKYPYGLLQVGIYLAAIDDAVKRCHEADAGGGGGGGGGGKGGGGGDGDIDGDTDGGGLSGDRHGEASGGGGGSGVREGAGSCPTASTSLGTQPPQRSACIGTSAMAPLGLEGEAICIDNAIKSGATAFVRLKYGVYDSIYKHVCHSRSFSELIPLHRSSHDRLLPLRTRISLVVAVPNAVATLQWNGSLNPT
ncbi:hypothetical protein M405DRAFT_928360 [Rhizopogon salebrosus TDB-379]|nr:hypothetical protein M405DRAFT_928360 [Rhizopogon salebrosus TDB-379]